jgi:hypothetical protein
LPLSSLPAQNRIHNKQQRNNTVTLYRRNGCLLLEPLYDQGQINHTKINDFTSTQNTQTHKQIDTQNHGHAKTQIHKHTSTQTHKHPGQAHKHSNTQAHMHTKTRHTSIQTRKHTNTRTHEHIKTQTHKRTITHSNTHVAAGAGVSRGDGRCGDPRKGASTLSPLSLVTSLLLRTLPFNNFLRSATSSAVSTNSARTCRCMGYLPLPVCSKQ